MNKNVKKSAFEFVVLICIISFCEVISFNRLIGTPYLFGDNGDGRLTNLITEHWWNFFLGKEKFDEIAMLYPAKSVMGYTDMFLGYGIFHSFFRLIGLDMYIAYKYSIMLIFFIGGVMMYYLLRVKLKCSIWWAYFGTIGFSFSSSLIRVLGNSQLAAINFLPILVILLMEWFQNYSNKKKRILYGCLFIVSFVLLTYTSWYVACYCGLFAIISLIVFIGYRKFYNCNYLFSFKFSRQLGIEIISYFVFMLILFIPFIKIYVPCFMSTSGYTYAACTEFLPEIIDIINVGSSNILMGNILKNMNVEGPSCGFSIVLLVLFLVLMISHRKRVIEQVLVKNESICISTLVIRVICVTVVIGILSVVSLGSNGISIWYIYYQLIPIVRSTRAVYRFLLWINFPMCVVTSYLANEFFSNKRMFVNILVGVILSILLYISNLDSVGAPINENWRHDNQIEFITSVVEPPCDVDCFYIIDSGESMKKAYEYQMDAFEIANYFSIKTINGYSGGTPIGFGEVFEVASDQYEPYILNILVPKYDLENVYAYDIGANLWIPISDRLAQNGGY